MHSGNVLHKDYDLTAVPLGADGAATRMGEFSVDDRLADIPTTSRRVFFARVPATHVSSITNVPDSHWMSVEPINFGQPTPTCFGPTLLILESGPPRPLNHDFCRMAVDALIVDQSRQFSGIFSELEDIRENNAVAEAQLALQKLSGDLGKFVSERLLRLTELALEEDTADSSSPSPESYRTLIAFLSVNRRIKVPELTLDASGYVWARWRKSRDCYAALRFYPDGTINFSFLSTDPNRPGKLFPVSGKATVSNMRSYFDAQPGLSWICGETRA